MLVPPHPLHPHHPLNSCSYSQSCGSAFIFSDPDPAVFLNADPDPAVFLNADPNPAVFLNADSDPTLQNCGVTFKLLKNYLIKVCCDPQVSATYFNPLSAKKFFDFDFCKTCNKCSF